MALGAVGAHRLDGAVPFVRLLGPPEKDEEQSAIVVKMGGV